MAINKAGCYIDLILEPQPELSGEKVDKVIFDIATIREAEEEIGVQVVEEDLKLVNTMHCNDGKEQWVNATFITEKWLGEPRICEPHKHSEVKWIDINNLPENVIPFVKQSIEDYLRGKYYSEYGWNNGKK